MLSDEPVPSSTNSSTISSTNRRRPLFADTKFLAPPVRESLIERSALVDRLRVADAVPLTIVVGSPGSGKSSLLGQWYSQCADESYTWLNADRGDEDPARFWRGFVGAVQQIEPNFGDAALSLIALDGGVTSDALEAILVDDGMLSRRIRVVVDDFHQVSLHAAQQLQHLLDRGLRNLRLVLGSRSDPVVGLHRLRMQGNLSEVREVDLRLDLDESGALLRAMGVDPATIDLAALHARTEGWVAGVYLAALSVMGTDDPAAKISELTGTTQTIAGYLTAEALSNQPPEVRRFLEQTCVADELDWVIVEALLGDDDTAVRAVTLEQVEVANLFLGRLDTAGTVFRYHHLFGELLRHQLQAKDPSRFREQHRRAGAAYERSGDVSLAVRHYWYAGDRAAAGQLIRERLVPVYLGTGMSPPPGAHLALTPDELAASPSDAIGYAVPLMLDGHAATAAALLTRAEALANASSTPVVDRLHLACARTAAELASGRMVLAIECADRVIHLLHHEGAEPDDMTAASIPFGIRACAWEGRFDSADRMIREISEHPDPRLSKVDIVSTVAFVELERGELVVAAQRSRAAHTTAGSLGIAGTGVDVAARAVLGCALLDEGRLDEAGTEFSAVLGSTPLERLPSLVLASVGRARELRARGMFDAALRSLASMRSRLGAAGTGPTFAARFDTTEIAILLALGDVDHADRLSAGLPDGFRTDLTRAWIATLQGRAADARDMVDTLSPSARTRRMQLDLGALRLRLAVTEGRKDVAPLAADLLDLAEPVGFILPIAEAGASVLLAVIAAARRRPRTTYIDRLLATQPLPRPADQARPEYRADELSARELVVLRYMATSMTNSEIADELYLSVNTVKTHIKHVLRKLGGASRADAVQLAQQLHYL